MKKISLFGLSETSGDDVKHCENSGFLIADSEGNIGLKYDENGLDCGKVSDHLKNLIIPETIESSIEIDSISEKVIGKYKYLNDYQEVEFIPLYESILKFNVNKLTSGVSLNLLFETLDKIDYSKYAVIKDISVYVPNSEVVYGNIFSSVEVKDNINSTIITVTPTTNINEYLYISLNFRYVKYDDVSSYKVIEFELEDGSIETIDELEVEVAPLKYDKKIVSGLQVDDGYADAYSMVFAHFNGRRMSASSGGDVCHQFQWEAGYRDQNLSSFQTQPIPLFTDGCGVDKRFKHGVVFWPQIFPAFAGAAKPYCLMPETLTNKQGAYVSHYTNFKEMLLYLSDVGSHNVFRDANYLSGRNVDYLGRIFELKYCDEANHESIAEGIAIDRELFKHLLGYNLRMHIVPDGNDEYARAARKDKKFSFTTSANTATLAQYLDNISYVYKSVFMNPQYMTGFQYNEDYKYACIDKPRFNEVSQEQYYNNTIARGWFSFTNYLTDFETEYAKPNLFDRRAMFIGTHGYHPAHIDAMNTLAQTYGKSGSDDLWFATETEYYDYYRIMKYSKIRVLKIGNKFKFKVYIPKTDHNGNSLEYLETTLKINLTENSIITFNSEDNRIINITHSPDKKIVNINADDRIINTINTLIERIGSTEIAYVRETYLSDLNYFVSQLKPSLANYYNNIINNL